MGQGILRTRKGVKLLTESPKKSNAGRPITKNRQSQINVRLSEEEISRIKEVAKQLNLTMADTIVTGVKMLADSLKVTE